MDVFLTFRKLSSMEDAQEYQNILVVNGIQSNIINKPLGVDLTFLGSTVGHEYEIQLLQEDFELAETILTKYEENKFQADIYEHYLYQFTNEELFEILQKPDEWNKIDYDLAQEILQDRGEHIDKSALQNMEKERLLELAEPEKKQNYRIIFGYLFAFLGGLLGVIIGYLLWNSKKALPNGEKVWLYKEADRKHGKIIFFIGACVFSICYFYRIFNNL